MFYISHVIDTSPFINLEYKDNRFQYIYLFLFHILKPTIVWINMEDYAKLYFIAKAQVSFSFLKMDCRIQEELKNNTELYSLTPTSSYFVQFHLTTVIYISCE